MEKYISSQSDEFLSRSDLDFKILLAIVGASAWAPIPSKSLEKMFNISGRTVRRCVKELRAEGFPIVSSADGYEFSDEKYGNFVVQRVSDIMAELVDIQMGLINGFDLNSYDLDPKLRWSNRMITKVRDAWTNSF